MRLRGCKKEIFGIRHERGRTYRIFRVHFLQFGFMQFLQVKTIKNDELGITNLKTKDGSNVFSIIRNS